VLFLARDIWEVLALRKGARLVFHPPLCVTPRSVEGRWRGEEQSGMTWRTNSRGSATP
jgi:hypothetical protein